MKNRGLGQGLASLLGNEALPPSKQEGLMEVYVRQLVPGKFQPRRVFKEEEIASLAQSIIYKGVLQPLLVRKTYRKTEDGLEQFEIIGGERRWRAAKSVRLDRVPVVVRDLEDQDVMMVALVENVQRESLTPLEEARAYERLIDEMDLTHEEISECIGKSRTHISNMCRLLELPESVQNLIEAGNLSVGHAKVLLSMRRGPTGPVVDEIMRKNLSVRQTEKLIHNIKKGGENKEENKDSLVALNQKKMSTYRKDRTSLKELTDEELSDVRRIEKHIGEKFNCLVKLYLDEHGGGDIVLSLQTQHDLDEFLAKVNTIIS